MPLSARLRKLLALANRAGTKAESDAARARAERLAERENLAIVTTTSGTVIAVEPDRADLLEALDRIINPREPKALEGGKRIGHDFGGTPFGIHQVAKRAAGGRDAPHLCICDPDLAELDIHDGRCPTHGLAATLRAAGARIREDEYA